MEQKTVDVNGARIPVLLNNRAMIEYERMRGKPASRVESFEDALALTFCSVRAGAISAKLKFEMDFETFIDYTDSHPDIIKKDEVPQDQEPDDDKKKASTM
ncbi:MAG: hypothetical protein WCY82_01675 [Desulfotomaculaceae bacterium]